MLPFKIITFFKGLSSCLCYELYYFMLPPSFVSVQSHPLALSVSLTVHLCQWSGAQGHEDTDCFMDAFHDTAACFLGAALVIIVGCVPGNPIRAYSVTKLCSPQCPRKAVFFPLFSFPFTWQYSTHFLSWTDLQCTLVCPHSITDNRVYIYYDDFMTDDVKCLKEGGLF